MIHPSIVLFLQLVEETANNDVSEWESRVDETGDLLEEVTHDILVFYPSHGINLLEGGGQWTSTS